MSPFPSTTDSRDNTNQQMNNLGANPVMHASNVHHRISLPPLSSILPGYETFSPLNSPSQYESSAGYVSSALSSPWIPPSPPLLRAPLGPIIAPKIVRTPSPPPPERPELQYSLTVVQQPSGARACGHGVKDRRMIDPVPFLTLELQDPNSPDWDFQRDLEIMSRIYCVSVELCDPTRNILIPGRQLIGNLTQSGYVAANLQGVMHCWFVFPDLSVRTIGKFRLRFKLTSVNPAHLNVQVAPSKWANATGNRRPIDSVVFSDVFEVFSAKDFKGFQPSSTLTRHLHAQNVPIKLKSGIRGPGHTGSGDGADDVVENAGEIEDRDEDVDENGNENDDENWDGVWGDDENQEGFSDEDEADEHPAKRPRRN